MLQRRIDDQPTLSAEMVDEAEQILHRHIRQVGLKQTAQRDTILAEALFWKPASTCRWNNCMHWCGKKIPQDSGATTVYRTLKLFTECGLASEVAFHDGVAGSRASIRIGAATTRGIDCPRPFCACQGGAKVGDGAWP